MHTHITWFPGHKNSKLTYTHSLKSTSNICVNHYGSYNHTDRTEKGVTREWLRAWYGKKKIIVVYVALVSYTATSAVNQSYSIKQSLTGSGDRKQSRDKDNEIKQQTERRGKVVTGLSRGYHAEIVPEGATWPAEGQEEVNQSQEGIFWHTHKQVVLCSSLQSCKIWFKSLKPSSSLTAINHSGSFVAAVVFKRKFLSSWILLHGEERG